MLDFMKRLTTPNNQNAEEEKKVEYIELIYDLIFVYLIGRNNSLLSHVQYGFISGRVFLTYVLATLAVIQIWNFTTFYINRYGKNGLREHVFLFVNMYLLYYMADGTRVYWQAHFYRYNIAWALILFNIGLQYFLEYRNNRLMPWNAVQARRMALIIWSEALLVLAVIIGWHFGGLILAPVPIAFGIIVTNLSGRVNRLNPVDFPHLSERAMLYVVFTFGEMIIAIAAYFEGNVSLNSIYFSTMAFLIVAGLFLSYGTVYDHILDREVEKTLFITGSILLYFLFLFMTGIYAKERMRPGRHFILRHTILAAVFVVLMLVFMENMIVNIAVSVCYVYANYLMLHYYGRILRA